MAVVECAIVFYRRWFFGVTKLFYAVIGGENNAVFWERMIG